MAKNRKKKAKDKDEAAAPTPAAASPSASSSSSSMAPVTAADVALKAGNFAAIRVMAAKHDAKAEALLPLTQIDMGQIVVGLIGMLVVLSVAFFTLHG